MIVEAAMRDGARRVREVFDLALAQPTAAQQDEFVRDFCRDDRSLAAAVLELLQKSRECERNGFLEWTPNTNGSDLHDANVGRELGSYRLIEFIGSGASGLVYRGARTDGLDQQVAIKLLRSSYHDASGLKRFQVEKQALADISHPGISRLITFGSANDGTPYLVMDWIDGERIDQRLQRTEPSVGTRVGWLLEIARIVLAAHEAGILHRDLKPGNLLITRDDRLVITDFGLAKFFGDARPEMSDLTMTGGLLGTPGYMAPEQLDARAGKITVAADVYGLGAVLFFLLTRRPPVRGSSPAEVVENHRQASVPSPREFEAGVDRDLETICTKCLQREPESRYQSVALLVDDLQRYLAGAPIAARPISTVERCVRWAKSNRLVAGTIAAFAGLFIVGFVTVTGFLVVTQRQKNALQVQRQELLGVVNSQLTEMADWLAQAPQSDSVRRGLLERAKEHAERISSFDPSDKEGRVVAAQSHYRLAKISQLLHDQDTLLAAATEAKRRFQDLADDYPQENQFKFDVFHCQFLLEDCEAALKTVSALVAVDDNPYYRDGLVACLRQLGDSERRRQNREQAEQYYREAYEVASQLAAEFPDDPFFRTHYDPLTVWGHGPELTHKELLAHTQSALSAIERSLADGKDVSRWVDQYHEIAKYGIVAALATEQYNDACDLRDRLLRVLEQAKRHAPQKRLNWILLGEAHCELAMHRLYGSDQDRVEAYNLALADLTAALRIWPDEPRLRALDMLFEVEFCRKSPANAAAALQLSSEVRPSYYLAPVLIRAGEFEAAERALSTAKFPHWQVYQALIHAERGEFEQAAAVLEDLAKYGSLPQYQAIAEKVRELECGE